jgi:hypothetical protein
MIKMPSPALPRDYVDCASKVRWDNALGQPILQGERCFAYFENDQVQLVTMDATPVTTVPRINSALHWPLTQEPAVILDGFLTETGIAQTVLQKRLKKLKADNTKVQFVLCDQISTAAFSERYKKLNAFTGALVTCAETVKIRNREDLNYYQSRCLLLGYPGVNLRHSAEGYKSNDSVFFLAAHTPKTKSYNVVDVKSGRGEFTNFAVAVCATDHGDEFEVMCPQHVVTSIELTTNSRKYISRRLTVAYFDLTFGDDIVPKYPVAVAFK